MDNQHNSTRVLSSGWAGLLLVVALAYFPSHPPSPPSVSSVQPRLGWGAGWRDIVTSGPCWLITLAYAGSQGISQTWQSTMVINLTQLDLDTDMALSEKWASKLGKS